jgi:hypothetical protein
MAVRSDGRTRMKMRATLRKREDSGNWKRERYIAICGELAVEETMDL